MKINKSWLFQNLSLFACYLVMLYALWCGTSSAISSGEGLKYWPLFLMIIILALATSITCIIDVFKGKAYYKYVDVPISEFDIKQYDNLITLVHENHAWNFTYKKDKIAKLEEIKTIHYHNIKKEFIGWKLIPYAGDL